MYIYMACILANIFFLLDNSALKLFIGLEMQLSGRALAWHVPGLGLLPSSTKYIKHLLDVFPCPDICGFHTHTHTHTLLSN